MLLHVNSRGDDIYDFGKCLSTMVEGPSLVFWLPHIFLVFVRAIDSFFGFFSRPSHFCAGRDKRKGFVLAERVLEYFVLFGWHCDMTPVCVFAQRKVLVVKVAT